LKPNAHETRRSGQQEFPMLSAGRPRHRKLHLIARLIPLVVVLLCLPPYQLVDASKEKRPTPSGTAVLWRKPLDIGSRNLFIGAGGASMRPDLRRITVLGEKKGGYSTKYEVRDASGQRWVVKLGKEAQSETAANRLLWGVGYVTEVCYLVPRVRIPGKGVFNNVKFEARPKQVERLGEWKWSHNPFVGTPELEGLKVLMVLINNWDIKDSNNEILLLKNRAAGKNELHYIISDLGATFGKTGSIFTRSRNEPEDFAKADFIDKVKGNYVDFHYSGKRKGLFDNISTESARWIGYWLSRLNDKQITDAFRAANFTPSQARTLRSAVRSRISALVTYSARRGDVITRR
jgi:hypothetical protein